MSPKATLETQNLLLVLPNTFPTFFARKPFLAPGLSEYLHRVPFAGCQTSNVHFYTIKMTFLDHVIFLVLVYISDEAQIFPSKSTIWPSLGDSYRQAHF